MAANAQATSSGTQSTALALSNAIAITFVGTGTATGTAVSLPFTTVSDYTNGVLSSAQQLKIQSNKVFNLTANATAANFTYSGTTTPSPVMPIAVLDIMVTANGTGGTVAGTYATAYNDVTSAAATLISGGLNGGNQTVSVQYRALPGFAYPAGTYTANIVYTATQP